MCSDISLNLNLPGIQTVGEKMCLNVFKYYHSITGRCVIINQWTLSIIEQNSTWVSMNSSLLLGSTGRGETHRYTAHFFAGTFNMPTSYQ